MTRELSQPSLTETLGESTRPGPGVPLAPGTRLGRYEITRLLGSGGVGRVYAARDDKLRREVAIKLLHERGMSSDTTTVGEQRLVREARAMASLAHPNVAQVLEVTTLGRRVAIVMELLPGGTLDQWMRARARSWPEVLAVFVEAGQGLVHAHEAGLVHRDFKPDNVLFGADGRPRVTDFGLARRSDTPDSTQDPSRSGAKLAAISGHSSWLGTPAYMAPEQHLGVEVDAQADQFAFAVSLYEAWYGRRPFVGRSVAEIALAVTDGRMLDPPRGTEVPARMWRILRRALQPDPSARWPGMSALLTRLQRRPSRGLWAATGLGVVGLAAVFRGFGSGPADPCVEAASRAEAVWGEGSRGRLTSAFAADPSRAVAVTRALDGWRPAWSEVYAATCREGRSVEARQVDLRLRCLLRQLPQVETLVETMLHGEMPTLERAAEFARAVPSVDDCASADLLRRRTPLPDDPAVRDAVAAVRDDIARALVLEKTGEFDAALQLARSALETAAPIGFGPLQAQAHHALGVSLERTGDYDAAAEHLTEAEHLASAHDLDDVAIEAGIELSYVVGYRQSNPDEGLRWARATAAAIERAGGDPDAEARLFINEAIIHERRGDYQAAFEGFDRARQRLEGSGGRKLASALINMGLMLNRLGRPREAVGHLRRAQPIVQRSLGPEHPLAAAALNNLGMAFEKQGDFEQANALYREALAAREAAYGPDHPQVAVTLNNVAIVEQHAGRLPEAMALVQRGLRIRERAYGADHPRTAFSLNMLATLHRENGELDLAVQLHHRALAIYEASLGADHPEVAAVLENLGTTRFRQGDLPAAERQHRRALAIREATLDEGHLDIATSRLHLGQVLAAQGDREQALRYFALARPGLEAQPEDDPDRRILEAGPLPPPAVE
jgi:serine/threonine-protein kinase